MQNWFLVMSKPKQDDVAKENLLAQGYEVYQPLLTHQKSLRGKMKAVVEPLFPRYLFVKLTPEMQSWAPVRSTIGVMQMVRFGSRPAQVSEEIIRSVQYHEKALNSANGQAIFEEGQSLRVESGPFAGHQAIFQSMEGDERVIALLSMLGNQQKVLLDLNDVSSAI